MSDPQLPQSQDLPDLNDLLMQAQALQEQLMNAQDQVAQQVVEGQASGGLVKIVVTGGMQFQSVHIDPSVAGDTELLEDLVLAALHDATSKVEQLNEEATGSIFG